jgi:hypothetical protein
MKLTLFPRRALRGSACCAGDGAGCERPDLLRGARRLGGGDRERLSAAPLGEPQAGDADAPAGHPRLSGRDDLEHDLGLPGHTAADSWRTTLQASLSELFPRLAAGRGGRFSQRASTFVALVTINIGAGDFADCLAVLNFSDDCRTSHQSEMTSNLATILAELRAAAGPNVAIVGMNYYDAFAGLWVLGDLLFGGDQGLAQALALASVGFTVEVNDALEATFASAQDPWADVETAFAVTNFADTAELPGVGSVPLNVFNACTLTLFCSNLDLHPNADGSAVIARAFEQVLPQPKR